MVKNFDVSYYKKESQLVPGGDLRQVSNQWFRVAWRDSGFTRLPRESHFRLIVRKLIRKKNLCILIAYNFKTVLR